MPLIPIYIQDVQVDFNDVAITTLTVTGHVPGVQLGTKRYPDQADLTITGQAPLFGINHVRQPGKADLTITGHEVYVKGYKALRRVIYPKTHDARTISPIT